MDSIIGDPATFRVARRERRAALLAKARHGIIPSRWPSASTVIIDSGGVSSSSSSSGSSSSSSGGGGGGGGGGSGGGGGGGGQVTTTDSKMAISTLYRHVAAVVKMSFACGDGSVQNTSAVASVVMTQLQENCDKREAVTKDATKS